HLGDEALPATRSCRGGCGWGTDRGTPYLLLVAVPVVWPWLLRKGGGPLLLVGGGAGGGPFSLENGGRFWRAGGAPPPASMTRARASPAAPAPFARHGLSSFRVRCDRH